MRRSRRSAVSIARDSHRPRTREGPEIFRPVRPVVEGGDAIRALAEGSDRPRSPGGAIRRSENREPAVLRNNLGRRTESGGKLGFVSLGGRRSRVQDRFFDSEETSFRCDTLVHRGESEDNSLPFPRSQMPARSLTRAITGHLVTAVLLFGNDARVITDE